MRLDSVTEPESGQDQVSPRLILELCGSLVEVLIAGMVAIGGM
jgi:hypothetical protein